MKHQDSVYRVAASRLKHVGKEFVIESGAATNDNVLPEVQAVSAYWYFK